MRTLRTLPLVVLAACSCSDDYILTPTDTAPPAALERDHGQYLAMRTLEDKVAVAYYDRDKGAVGFATARPTPLGNLFWRHEEVDGFTNDDGLDVGDRGQYVSMAVDDDKGLVWLAYHDAGTGALRVAHRLPDGLWHSVKADIGTGGSPNAGLYTSIQLAEDGWPVVAHFDEGKGVLRTSRRDADGFWSSTTVWEGEDVTYWDTAAAEEVTNPADVGRFAELLIDGQTEYIALYDKAAGDLVLLEGFADAYADTLVYSAGDVGRFPSMLLEDDGTLHIAFQDVTNQDLLLATRVSGGDFEVQEVSTGDFHGADTEVFRIDDERLGILFFDGRENNMMLAVQTETGWDVETVGGDEGAVGFFNEVVEIEDRFFAASYDYTSRNIFVSELFSDESGEDSEAAEDTQSE